MVVLGVCQVSLFSARGCFGEVSSSEDSHDYIVGYWLDLWR